MVPDLDSATGFWREDGIHLNEVGMEFYLDYLKDNLLKNIQFSFLFEFLTDKFLLN